MSTCSLNSPHLAQVLQDGDAAAMDRLAAVGGSHEHKVSVLQHVRAALRIALGLRCPVAQYLQGRPPIAVSAAALR